MQSLPGIFLGPWSCSVVLEHKKLTSNSFRPYIILSKCGWKRMSWVFEINYWLPIATRYYRPCPALAFSLVKSFPLLCPGHKMTINLFDIWAESRGKHREAKLVSKAWIWIRKEKEGKEKIYFSRYLSLSGFKSLAISSCNSSL